jgi:chromosome partitioning protein
MLIFKSSTELRRVVVLNPKGGSGKTTLAFNLAGYIASTGRKVALVDMDRQGSSTRWIQNRGADHPRIHGISSPETDGNGDQIVDVPEDIDIAVIDAPAGVTGAQLTDYTCGAHAILLPILPSDLDIHAAASLVKDLLLVAQVSRRNGRLAVVANRVNERTVAYQQLSSFLKRLSIAVVGTLRDTQNYVWAASNGLSIHEMRPSRVGRDLDQWSSVTHWLEGCLAKPLTPRDLLRPAEDEIGRTRSGLVWKTPFLQAAAAVLVVVSMVWAMTPRNADVTVLPEASLEIASVATVGDDSATSDQTVAASASEELRQKWQLDGIAKVGDSSVVIVSDRQGPNIRRIRTGDDLEGWTVADSGANFAVFSQDGEEARLMLNDEPSR